MEREKIQFWSGMIFLAGMTALVFQVFPAAWWWVINIVDVRQWTWLRAAVASTIAILFLAVLRAWQENAWNSR